MASTGNYRCVRSPSEGRRGRRGEGEVRHRLPTIAVCGILRTRYSNRIRQRQLTAGIASPSLAHHDKSLPHHQDLTATMRLKDKVVIVTGSTTGIGEAIARLCVENGAKVLIHGRDEERGRAVVESIGSQAALHVDNLADPAAGQRLVDAAVKAFGKLDSVVNNAAWVVRSDLDSTTPEMFDKVMATNVRGPLMLIKAAFPKLRETRGTILNIGSFNAYCGENNLLAYSISKGGLLTMSKNLADAFSRTGVRVNHFNVGWVLTPNEYHYKIADGMPTNWPEQVAPITAPSGRLMAPEDIARSAIYWISEESRPITGSVVDLEQYPALGRNPSKQLFE
jgi:NAD(P)-dependent dehydrogenase (short-subunit alcohol dehydrogenase family)